MRSSLVSLRGPVSSVVGITNEKTSLSSGHTPLLRVAAMSHELPRVVESLRWKGIGAIVDYAVEHQPPTETRRVANVIERTIVEMPEAMHAIKLSALGLEEAPTAAGQRKKEYVRVTLARK